MQSERRKKFVTATILIILMLIVIASIQENGTPTATYELIIGEPLDEDESIAITSSPQAPVTSALSLNDSLLGPDSIWFTDSDRWTGQIHLSRQIPVPRINVSTITLRLSAFIVKGPINLKLRYYDWPQDVNVNGSTGETVEIVRHILPDDLGNDGLAWIVVWINSTDLSVIDHLYFSVSLVFTTEMLPVSMDLQRTDGNSLINLPEFYFIYQTSNRPYVQIDEYKFYISQVNDTIFLPSGTYSLYVRWDNYQYYFGNLIVDNESLVLELRIKTVRIDVESVQKIPGIAVYVGSAFDEFYRHAIMVADEPSYYLPSTSSVQISVRGEVGEHYWPHHFTFYVNNYGNRNVTLIVSENWISIGNIAFTPSRFSLLFGLISIFVLTIVILRKELLTSSIYLPFLFLFLSNTLPMYSIYRGKGEYPFYRIYTETETVSTGVSTSVTNISGTTITISDAGYEIATQIGFISIALLLVVFFTVIYEYLRKEQDPETSDFPVLVPIMCSLVLQTVFIVGVFFSTLNYSSFSLGPGIAFTSLALLTWIVLYKQRGKTIFETS
ncbi:MAG: hypothetical protein ACFFDM_11185 [Candidatus Thorarchaeota archaeon]